MLIRAKIETQPEVRDLLKYIVQYRNIRDTTTAVKIVDQLILAYGKQLVSGMPERHWRDNMLVHIQEAEESIARYNQKRHERYQVFRRKEQNANH